jgi:hypothetical protein
LGDPPGRLFLSLAGDGAAEHHGAGLGERVDVDVARVHDVVRHQCRLHVHGLRRRVERSARRAARVTGLVARLVARFLRLLVGLALRLIGFPLRFRRLVACIAAGHTGRRERQSRGQRQHALWNSFHDDPPCPPAGLMPVEYGE